MSTWNSLWFWGQAHVIIIIIYPAWHQGNSVQRLQFAILFNQISFSQAFTNKSLLKSLIYMCLGCLVVLLIWLMPILLLVGLVGLTPLGVFTLGLCCFLAVVFIIAWCEVSASFVYVNGTNKTEPEQQVTDSHEIKLMSLLGRFTVWHFSQPGLLILQMFQKFLNHPSNKGQTLWEQRYLIMPLTSLEGIDLMTAVDRVNQIAADNLIRIQPNLIGVRLMARLFQVLSTIFGIGFGYLVSIFIAGSFDADLVRQVLSTTAGMFVGGGLISLGCIFSSFTRSLYYLSLYLWVRNVELAQELGTPEIASPPVHLKLVLGHGFGS